MLYDVLTVLTVVSAQKNNTLPLLQFSFMCTGFLYFFWECRKWSPAPFSAWLRREETGNKIFAVRTGRKSSWHYLATHVSSSWIFLFYWTRMSRKQRDYDFWE